jgi:hypothetical protein
MSMFQYYWVAMLFFGVMLYVPGGFKVSFVTALLAPFYPFLALYGLYSKRYKPKPFVTASDDEQDEDDTNFDFKPGGFDDDLH